MQIVGHHNSLKLTKISPSDCHDRQPSTRVYILRAVIVTATSTRRFDADTPSTFSDRHLTPLGINSSKILIQT